MKKKAFTLTELLVVVVIIGVLSAVVLPKFNKVIESRRTAEAESVMRAVRNEQEMRCTLDQNYTTNKDKLAVWPKQDSANYTYALNAGGMSATRKDKDYTLEIKTYLDGGICCRGSYCSSLNKDYPLCDDYEATPNTKDCVPANVEEESGVEPNPEPEPVPACQIPIQTIETQTCGCTNSGTKTRTFNEGSCGWDEWSACSEKEENCCAVPSQTTETQSCGCTNSGTKTRTFNEGSCGWDEWSACSEKEENCCAVPSQTTETQSCGCTNKGTKTRTFNEDVCDWNDWGQCSEEEKNCSCDPDGSKRAACVPEKQDSDGRTFQYTWNESDCSCTESCVYHNVGGNSFRPNCFFEKVAVSGNLASDIQTAIAQTGVVTCESLGVSENSVGNRNSPDCWSVEVYTQWGFSSTNTCNHTACHFTMDGINYCSFGGEMSVSQLASASSGGTSMINTQDGKQIIPLVFRTKYKCGGTQSTSSGRGGGGSFGGKR